MDFSFKPKVTKELLLSMYSEETYMEYYLGIQVKKGKLYRSPLRTDSRPTASFYRNKSGELIFKDFGSDFSGNFISVVMEKYNVNYYKALDIIANDFNIVNTNITKKVQESRSKISNSGPAKIQVEIQDFSNKELEWWNNYGITPKILKKYHVYSCKTVFLNGNIFAKSQEQSFIFGYYGGKSDDCDLWRLYFPKKKSYRFISNWSSKKIQGFNQIPKSGKLLVITKSLKDVMCLYSLGIHAIAPNSETVMITDSVLEQLKKRFEHIVVLLDNDLAGISNMNKMKKQHPEFIYTWLPRSKAKDISDFYKAYGREETLNIIKQFVEWLSRH